MLSNSMLVLSKSEFRKVHFWPVLKSHFRLFFVPYRKVIILCYISDLKKKKTLCRTVYLDRV